MEIKENVSLKPFTVFQVGGPARFFIDAGSKEEIIRALEWTRDKKVPYFILGLGSNILVSDKGFPGLVIKISGGRISRDGDLITVEAGAKMAEVVNFSLQNDLVGFEWAIGIPGTVGGSVRGNAGCFGSEMKDAVQEVEGYDMNQGRFFSFDNGACEFSYRHSIFKERPELIVLEVLLKLRAGDPKQSRDLVRKYTQHRLHTQDIGRSSAGSVFKNVAPGVGARLPPGVKAAGSGPADFIAIASLIETAGLKGFKIGGVMVSPKHANFIINTGDARAEDIVMLVGLIKERIHRKFGIQLEEEIQYVGF
ncbi:MAG: UDP-N-acetylmuramate dehydrogenase [bacterium]|nr:UDP-N-acetylmuramate dehydrogenase [bacterium]